MSKDNKKCPQCGEVKPVEGFYRSLARGDGHAPYCQECEKAIKKKRSEEMKTAEPESWRSKSLITSARYRAKLLKVNFTITKGWLLKKLETGTCEVTGVEFSDKIKKPPSIYAPSIDRVVPEEGYTPGNCRVVLLMVNEIKRDYSDEDIIAVGKALEVWGEKNNMGSNLEADLLSQLKDSGLCEGMVREFKAVKGRRFRVDFCWPEKNLAVEVQGGIWTRGRHSRPAGIVKDYEKFNLLTLGGWRILLLTSLDVKSGRGVEMIQDALWESSSS